MAHFLHERHLFKKLMDPLFSPQEVLDPLLVGDLKVTELNLARDIAPGW